MNVSRRSRFATTLMVAGLGLVIYSVILLFTLYERPRIKPVDLSAVEQARIPTAYRFVPKPDITAYELAMVAVMTATSTQYLPIVKPWYDVMPENVKRHFEVPTETMPQTMPPAAPVPHPDKH